jgi:hypothetical protein
MDMICPVCEEPFDNDCLHEVAKENSNPGGLKDRPKTYNEVARLFRTKGCGVAFAGTSYDNTKYCVATNSGRSEALGMLAELMGDDTDGYMAMAEDMDAMDLF